MRYYVVDAFTSEAFKGNPAAVVVLDRAITDAHMQAIAAEFNLAETAFVLPEGQGGDEACWSLRWFTPVTEVDLCGHATLASAFAIWQQLGHAKNPLRFSTQSGELTACLRDNYVELNFPAIAVSPCSVSNEVLTALKLNAVATSTTQHDLLIEVSTQAEVCNYRENIPAISALPQRGLIITAAQNTNDDVDFVSRFFAPKLGIDEDSVTGAIHCALGPYWREKLHKPSLRARQASPRGGELTVTPKGDRVLLAGQAVCTMAGELLT